MGRRQRGQVEGLGAIRRVTDHSPDLLALAEGGRRPDRCLIVNSGAVLADQTVEEQPHSPDGTRSRRRVRAYFVDADDGAKRSIKLACRNLWKVFGQAAEEFMRRHSGEQRRRPWPRHN